MTVPDIITEAGALLQEYRVLFCDVWGVVHNGAAPYRKACAALKKFRGNGGTVILVSNAPVPKAQVQSMLDRVGVPSGIADDIVSSGDIALRHIANAEYSRVFYIGPPDRDAAFFRKSSAKTAPLESADAIVCTGLNDDRSETAEDYRDLLNTALKRDLPFVCANPDLVVDVGDKRFYCAGAIADIYEQMGGPVYWAGKPHVSAYNTAMLVAQATSHTEFAKSEALVIGDAVRTDIEGAKRSGHDALFVAGGIHHDIITNDSIRADALADLFSGDAPPARAAMVELNW